MIFHSTSFKKVFPLKVCLTIGSTTLTLFLVLLSDFNILYTQSLNSKVANQGIVEFSLVSTDAQTLGSELTLETVVSPGYYYDISCKDVDVLRELLKNPETPTTLFKALLPNAARVYHTKDQMIPSPNHHRSDSGSYKLFTLLIFAMANDFAGLNSVPIDEIMEYLKRHTSTRLLMYLLSASGPESEAFAEKLFQAAIWTQDARIIKILLRKGLDPNDLICVSEGEKYTPLEISSTLLNVEITRLLLDAKVDVNRSIAGKKDTGGAIEYVLKAHWWRNDHLIENVRFELIHMLLEAGCNYSMQHVHRGFARQ